MRHLKRKILQSAAATLVLTGCAADGMKGFKYMIKLIYPSLIILLSVTTPAIAQTTNPVFLDCSTVGQFLRPREEEYRKELHFKLDFDNGEVLKLFEPSGKYTSLCKDSPKENTIIKSEGECRFEKEYIEVSLTDTVHTVSKNVDSYTFYRNTGFIDGSTRMYSEDIQDKLKNTQKKPILHLEFTGNCRRGVDKSTSNRAF
jgi:hypothetical protein